jgi:acetyl esterase/lipase
MSMLRRLQACGGGARILSIDYGLSPDYPYPSALNQVKDAYDWLTNDMKVAPSRIVISGKCSPSPTPRI